MITPRERAGFTLVELMMVVGIVAILAAIAYPSYQEQIRRSRRWEGKGLLLDIAQALEKCKTAYGRYDHPNCRTAGNIRGGNTISSTEGFYQVSAPAIAGNTYRLIATLAPGFSDPRCQTLVVLQNGDTCINRGVADECVSTNDPEARDCW